MKPIRVNDFSPQIMAQLQEKAKAMMEKPLMNTKFSVDIDIKDLFKHEGKAILGIRAEAYMKMMYLTTASDYEVAAHGIVTKQDNVYTVNDIFLYPQQVTGITVKATDDYGPWMMELPDDVFNSLRFQMHSHVNMGTSPSGVDFDYYADLMADVQDFYVFLVFNKRYEYHALIYDIEENVVFENEDINLLIVMNNGISLKSWWGEESKHVSKYTAPAATPPATTTPPATGGSNVTPIGSIKTPGGTYERNRQYSEQERWNATTRKWEPWDPVTGFKSGIGNDDPANAHLFHDWYGRGYGY